MTPFHRDPSAGREPEPRTRPRRLWDRVVGPLDGFDRRLLLAIWAAIACTILMGAGLGILAVRNEYQVQTEKAEITTAALARAFEESVLRFMKNLDRLAMDASRLYLRHRSEELPELFKERAALEEAVLQVAVIGPDGRLVATSLGMEHAGMDLSDRAHFRYHAQGGGEPVFISDPLVGRASKRWSVQFTRRIEGAAGQLAGVLVLSVDIGYFNGFYGSIHLGPEGAVTLIKTNGVVLGRSLEQDQFIGQRVSATVVPGMLERGDVGSTVLRSKFDQVERITAWRKIPGYPVLVTLGESTVRALASAHALAWRLALIALSTIAVLLVVGSLSRRTLIARALTRRAEAALSAEQRERAFLDSVLDTTAALVAVFDREGRLTLANKCFRAMAGEQGANEGARLLSRLFAVEADAIDLDALPGSCDASISDAAGLRRHVSWAITTIRDQQGRATQIVLFGFDDTERREAEFALYQASRLLTLGEIATGLAHELNQPLMIMRLAAESLVAAAEEPELDRAYIGGKAERIMRHVARAAAIVDNMRIFSPRKERRFEPTDVANAVEGVLGMMGTEIRRNGIEVRNAIRPGQWRVTADLVMLEQVLVNLLTNARDAILARRAAQDEADDGWIAIEAAGRAPGWVELTVSDNGTGIPPAIMERIFDPFFTTKPVGQGTGLGLALSYGLVRDMGGQIMAGNGRHGAVLSVHLPAAETEGGPAAPAAEPALASA
jgi:C4-dicarboxylate-specific signal transduction histidine kinase